MMTIPEVYKPGDRVAVKDEHRCRWFVFDDYDAEGGGPLAGIVMSEADAKLLVDGKALLRELEWSGEHVGRRWCRVCHRPEKFGHSEDCRLVVVLKAL